MRIISPYQKFDSFEDYLGAKEYLSSSGLKTILKSPAHYLASLQKEDEEEKDSLTVGSAVHCLCLEPSEFNNRFFNLSEFMPAEEMNWRMKANRQKRDHLKETAKMSGMTLVDPSQMERIQFMAESVRKNKKAMSLLENTICESSFYYELPVDEDFTAKVRIRPDALAYNGSYYLSLKTTVNASPFEWYKQSYKFRYDISEAFYFDILRQCITIDKKNDIQAPIRGWFICVENTAPHMCSIFDMNPLAEQGQFSDFLSVGKHHMDLGLMRLKECYETGIYKGYEIESDSEGGVFPMELPAYAKYEASNKII
jgi:hypothetical protein